MTQKRTNKRRWGCAGAVLLSLCCLVALAPFALRGAAWLVDNWPDDFNLPSVTEVAVVPPASATPQPESLGALSADESGGVFETDDVIIEIEAGALSEAAEFDVAQSEITASSAEEEVFYQSPLYHLTGPLDAVDGDITFTLPLPPEALEASAPEGAGDPAENLHVVLVQETFAPSAAGMVTSEYRLPSEVDVDAGVIRATLRLTPPEPGLGRTPRPLASLELIPPPVQSESTTDTITVKVEGRWCSTEVTSSHFYITYSGCAIERSLVEGLAQMLEDQRTKLEDLGFSFSGAPDPLYVYLEKFDGSTSRAGQFNPSKRGAGYTTLSFNRYYFLTAPWDKSERADLQATAGHELFHLVQFIYDPRWAYTKAVSPGPTLWMDEAAATWFEPLAIDDPVFLPPNAAANANFVRTPLYHAPVEQASGQGYGASLFLRYLTDKYDDSLILKTYEALRAGVYSETAAEAFGQALDARDASVGLEWVPFLETYFVRPGEIVPGFGGPDVDKWAALHAAATSDGSDYEISFDVSASFAGQQPRVSPGLLTAGPNATLSIDFTLGDLSADAFRLTFDTKKGDTLKALAAPGQMRVTVDAPEWGGVLVYGIPRDGSSAVPLAGAPWGFLSSGDSASEPGSQIVVSGLSHADGQGQYKGLLLIPFNYMGVRYTRPDSATVSVELAYLAAPPVPTPEPTQAPLPACDCANIPPGLAGLQCRLQCEAIQP